MANIRYFPSSGTTNDVGGIISTTRRKNTWRLIRMEIDSVTCNDKIFLSSWYKGTRKSIFGIYYMGFTINEDISSSSCIERM